MSDLVDRPILRRYLSNVRDWHGYIRFLGLPDLRDNRDILIDRLFVEPLLMDRHISADEDPSSWLGEAETVFEVLKTGRPIVLLGDPGTGKSTLLNYLVWMLSRPTQRNWAERMGDWLLPLPMVLRELVLRDVTDFYGLLDAFLNHAMSEPLREGDYLKQILHNGQALLLLDGIDELGDRAAREDLRSAVLDGMTLYPNCKWLLSSRVVGYDEVPFNEPGACLATISSPIGQFLKKNPSRLNVSSLPQDEMSEVHKQSQKSYVSTILTRYIAPFDDERIAEFSRNWYIQREAATVRAGRDATHLVRAVQADDAIHRLARIPNLLTMMALIHRIEATLPDGRALLYERIAEAYLETIDKHKGVYSGAYNLPEKRRWLARVGYEMQRRRSQGIDDRKLGDESALLVSAESVVLWLKEEMRQLRGTNDGMSAEEFLDFIGRRSGLFLPRGEDRYAFVHLSFQEYFAAVALEEEVTGIRWARKERTRLGLKRRSLSARAEHVAWAETFAFLFELLASKGEWYKDLIDVIFGRNFSKVERQKPKPRTMNLVRMLMRLVVNQHSGLSAESKESAIRCSIRTVLRHDLLNQFGSLGLFYDRYSQTLLQDLLGKDSEWNKKVVKIVAEQANDIGVDSLRFAKTGIADIGPLAEFCTLKSLNLSDSKVTDITPLGGLTALEFLNLAYTEIGDFRPLAKLEKLTSLNLEGTRIIQLDPLAGLTKLESLDFDNTQVADLNPLSSLVSLSSLHLSSTLVVDLSPLSNLVSLVSLYLNNTEVVDLSPLGGLKMLKSLGVGGANVKDLRVLASLTTLESLSLCDTRVSDLSALANHSALESLDLEGTQVTDVGPLAGLKKLNFLDLRGTSVSDLSPLSEHSALISLTLWDTEVSDVSSLSGLTSLQRLDLDGTNVSDIDPLVGLKDLQILDLRHTPVSEAATEYLKVVLPKCNIQV